MEVDGYLFITICYLLIFISGYLISKLVNFSSESNRFESIDGFRGLLATGVFIHHSIVWYNYIHIEKWKVPQNYLSIHLGESCVAFFFMITSFLFTNKLINSKKQDFQFWKNILYSRILRLVPLYFIIITFCIVFILIVNNFILDISISSFIIKCLKWYSFTILGIPIISESIDINRMLSGVTWSLPYEWLFYFFLPILGFILRKNKNILSIIISLIFVIFYLKFKTVYLTHFISFLGGMIPVFIIKYKQNINLKGNFYSVLTIICLIIALSFESSNDNYISKIFLIITFSFIALKNNIFGLLNTNFLKYLGEISYSTYLIHGLLLFTTFYFIGYNNIKKFTPIEYTCIISSLIFPLIAICSMSFYFIEKPFLNLYHKYIKK